MGPRTAARRLERRSFASGQHRSDVPRNPGTRARIRRCARPLRTLSLDACSVETAHGPAFAVGTQASWTRALGVIALSPVEGGSSAQEEAIAWLLKSRGRGAHWLWRWKFKVVDTRAHIDSDKYRWPWILGANNWVIPTAFAIVALKQFAARDRSEHANERIRVGTGTLLDRACLRGGWNARNRRCLWSASHAACPSKLNCWSSILLRLAVGRFLWQVVAAWSHPRSRSRLTTSVGKAGWDHSFPTTSRTPSTKRNPPVVYRPEDRPPAGLRIHLRLYQGATRTCSFLRVKQARFPNTMIIEQIFLQETSS